MRLVRLASIASVLPFLVVCLGAARAEDEMIDNPEYTQWSQFKVGAFATMKTETSMGEQSTTMTTKTKLVELADDHAVLETTTTMTMMGQEIKQPAQKRQVPAKIAKMDPPEVEGQDDMPKPTMKEGTETVTVKGKSIACKTVESTFEYSGMKTWSKSWSSDKVPGSIVKMESKSESSMGATTVKSTLEDFATE